MNKSKRKYKTSKKAINKEQHSLNRLSKKDKQLKRELIQKKRERIKFNNSIKTEAGHYRLLKKIYNELKSKDIKGLSKVLKLEVDLIKVVFKKKKILSKEELTIDHLTKVKKWLFKAYEEKLRKEIIEQEKYLPTLKPSRKIEKTGGPNDVYKKLQKNGIGKIIYIPKIN